jgi:transcriptional regulator with XRE-family HTH domain
MSQTFGETIREARVAMGISYRNMGKDLGVQHVVIFEVERGARMPFKRIDRLKAVSDRLSLNIEDLVVKSLVGRGLMPLLALGGDTLIRHLQDGLSE